MRFVQQSLACLMLALITAPVWSQSFVQSPEEIVSDVIVELEADLAINAPAYRDDPTLLFELVDRILEQRFDTQYAGRLVLGRWWTPSTPEQRQEFVDALFGSLVRRYSLALLGFDSDFVEVLPTRAPLQNDRQVVKTRVTLADTIVVPVDYSFYLDEGVWKAFDVSVEGRSYVRYFRDVIGNDVAKLGLDAVIARLNETEWTDPDPDPDPAGQDQDEDSPE